MRQVIVVDETQKAHAAVCSAKQPLTPCRQLSGLDSRTKVGLFQMQAARPMLDETGILRLVVAGTASETGAEFFRTLVRNLAQALGTSGAWVTEYLPEQQRLRALAMWLKATGRVR